MSKREFEQQGERDVNDAAKSSLSVDKGYLIPGLSLLACLASFSIFYFSTTLSAQQELGKSIPTIASILFWSYLALFLFSYPLRSSFRIFADAVRKSKGMDVLFVLYLIIHLVVYGIFLELILESIYRLQVPGSSPLVTFFLSTNYQFSPHDIYTTLLVLTLNPNLSILFPRALGVALGPFAIFSAIIIDVLVVSNVSLLLKVRSIIRKYSGSIALPTIGIVGGASCCISIPSLLAIASPSIAAFLYLPVGIMLQNALYYGLPAIVIVVLALNLWALRPLCR